MICEERWLLLFRPACCPCHRRAEIAPLVPSSRPWQFAYLNGSARFEVRISGQRGLRFFNTAGLHANIANQMLRNRCRHAVLAHADARTDFTPTLEGAASLQISKIRVLILVFIGNHVAVHEEDVFGHSGRTCIALVRVDNVPKLHWPVKTTNACYPSPAHAPARRGSRAAPPPASSAIR